MDGWWRFCEPPQQASQHKGSHGSGRRSGARSATLCCAPTTRSPPHDDSEQHDAFCCAPTTPQGTPRTSLSDEQPKQRRGLVSAIAIDKGPADGRRYSHPRPPRRTAAPVPWRENALGEIRLDRSEKAVAEQTRDTIRKDLEEATLAPGLQWRNQLTDKTFDSKNMRDQKVSLRSKNHVSLS